MRNSTSSGSSCSSSNSSSSRSSSSCNWVNGCKVELCGGGSIWSSKSSRLDLHLAVNAGVWKGHCWKVCGPSQFCTKIPSTATDTILWVHKPRCFIAKLPIASFHAIRIALPQGTQPGSSFCIWLSPGFPLVVVRVLNGSLMLAPDTGSCSNDLHKAHHCILSYPFLADLSAVMVLLRSG